MSTADADLKKAAGKLKKTRDGLTPAARAESDRRAARKQKRGLIAVAITVAASNLALVLICGLLAWFAIHPQREYFASDNGRIIPLVPLSRPYRKPSDVIAFARKTLEQSFVLDFNDYRGELEAVRDRYTKEGFASFINGLVNSDVLNMVKTRRMNLTSSTGVGVLAWEGQMNGAYTWVVRFPITLKLVGQSSELPAQKMMATVRVQRVSTLASVQGIGVAQVVTKPE